MSGDFTPEQKRYLEGFTAGLADRPARARPAGATARRAVAAQPMGPDAEHLRAQDRVLAAGGKLSEQEKFKRELHPFDAYERLKEQAAGNAAAQARRQFPLALLRLVLCRPGAELLHVPAAHPERHPQALAACGLADLAARYGGGYAHVTTRANLQIREVEPKNAVAMVEEITDLGLCSRGAGADNIRNVTGSPTAGIDPQELIDTRPYAREWHFHILNERALYGLPRKFNVAYRRRRPRSGARGHQRHRLPGSCGQGRLRYRARHLVPPAAGRHHRPEGFRARDRRGREARRRHQGRGRGRARLHRAWRPHRPQQGAVEICARRSWRREIPGAGRGEARERAHARPARSAGCRVRPSIAPPISACSPQKQAGLHWIGVVLPVGKLTVEQMHGLAGVARDFGDGDIRLTVWQNLLISGVPAEQAAGRRRSHRGAWPLDQRHVDPRRAGRLHRQCRLPLLRLRHQAPRRGNCALVRGPRQARRPGEHPSHRMPPFLRAALHRRHRAARAARCRPRRRRRRRGLSHPGRRRLRAGRRARRARSSAT